VPVDGRTSFFDFRVLNAGPLLDFKSVDPTAERGWRDSELGYQGQHSLICSDMKPDPKESAVRVTGRETQYVYEFHGPFLKN
jgi:hypothetical protein